MTDCNTSPVTTKSSFLSSLVGRHQIPVVTSNPRSISARRRHNYNEKQPHVSTGSAAWPRRPVYNRNKCADGRNRTPTETKRPVSRRAGGYKHRHRRRGQATLGRFHGRSENQLLGQLSIIHRGSRTVFGRSLSCVIYRVGVARRHVYSSYTRLQNAAPIRLAFRPLFSHAAGSISHNASRSIDHSSAVYRRTLQSSF